ncbi:MAG TPA: hypothetical protein VFK04_13800 [Gemmatimonadaceae bacterium]|nr:hypothetical protein [Gemmatimonadaceae bacterium]
MPDDPQPPKADKSGRRNKHARSTERSETGHSLDDVPVEVAAGGVWAARPISDQPGLRLARWQIYAVQQIFVFVGYNLDDREGRVSSAIQSLDVTARRGVTESGRVYELVGEPGRDGDGEWVFSVWLRMFGTGRSDVRAVSLEEAARMLVP